VCVCLNEPSLRASPTWAGTGSRGSILVVHPSWHCTSLACGPWLAPCRVVKIVLSLRPCHPIIHPKHPTKGPTMTSALYHPPEDHTPLIGSRWTGCPFDVHQLTGQERSTKTS
jgi:hypothetical protein